MANTTNPSAKPVTPLPVQAVSAPNAIRIVRVEPKNVIAAIEKETGNTNGAIQNPDFELLSKSYEPVVDKIAGILDGAATRTFKTIATKKVGEAHAEKFADKNVRMTKEARDTLKFCGARMIARRTESSELIDIVALSAVGADWVTGLLIAVSELKKLPDIQKEKKSE